MNQVIHCERAVFENAWEMAPGLYRILLPLPWSVPFVNAYLLQSGDQWLLLDCGLNWDPSLRALGRALKAIGVPQGGLDLLLLTHRHSDHAGGAGPVAQRWAATTYLHPTDQALRWPEPAERERLLLEHGFKPEHVQAIMARQRADSDKLPPELLPLEHEFTFGDLRFQVIHAPGHCPGQVMLLERQRGWLFAADHLLQTPSFNVWYHSEQQGDVLGQYLQSLEAARPLADQGLLVLPGHGLPFTDIAGAIDGMTAVHTRRAEHLLALLGSESLSAYELMVREKPILAHASSDRGDIAEVAACLYYLAARGQVTKIADGPVVRWRAADPQSR